MSTAARKKNKKDPLTGVIPTLTKKLDIAVCKMKVTELNKWTPVLQSEKTLKLCFEGHVSRINGQKRRYIAYKTQPLDARLGSYLFRQVNGELCSLVGDLYDPSNNLPLQVKSKFKNGIPKRWQSIAEFWDSIQKHSFCSKNAEQREVERAHLINSHLELIRTNLELIPVQTTDNIGYTPRQPVENNCNTINGIESRHCTTCENQTENLLRKKRVCHKISAHKQCFNIQTQQNSENHLNDTRRSSINKRKLLTCKRKLIVAEIQSKMCRSSKASKNTYEKVTKKYHYRCLPHRRKYLLRSSSSPRLLQKNKNCKKEPRVRSVSIRHNDRIVIPQRKQPLQAKRKLNVTNNEINQCEGKQSLEGTNGKEGGSCNKNGVKYRVLEPEAYSELCRKENSMHVEKNEECETLACKQPCLLHRDVRSDNVSRSSANRVRRSKRHVHSQDRGSGIERPKTKPEQSPPQKANRRDVTTPQSAYEDSVSVIAERKPSGYVETSLSPKRHEERNYESIPAEGQDLLKRKVTLKEISQDMSKTDSLSEKVATSKCYHSRLASSERQRESRRTIASRKFYGNVEPPASPKRHEERNSESIPAKGQDLLKRKMTPKEIPQDISKRESFSEKVTMSRGSRLVSSERQRESRTIAARTFYGYVKAPASPKRHEEKSFQSNPAEGRDLLKRKVNPRKISQDMSKRDRFSKKVAMSKCYHSSLASSDRQRESKRSVVSQLNEKRLQKIPGKSRKKSISTKKSNIDVTSAMKITAETLEDTKEAATTLGTLVSSASKRKNCKDDSKQPMIEVSQSSEEIEVSVPSKDIAETPLKKIEKPEPQLSLGDIDDILNIGAPRTLKQRKKLRKTIDSYAKTQNTCTDLFSDPDYNHLISSDTCSSQQWDRDYAEAVEELVSGKFSDQISLGSTSPAQYMQDFVNDDNLSVRSTSPFERTPCEEEFKVRYVHRVLKEKNEHSKRKSLNVDFLSSLAHSETDASTEADVAYSALIQGKPVSQKLFDLKCKKKDTSSDDSSSEFSDEV